jgi:hypothetical protein
VAYELRFYRLSRGATAASAYAEILEGDEAVPPRSFVPMDRAACERLAASLSGLLPGSIVVVPPTPDGVLRVMKASEPEVWWSVEPTHIGLRWPYGLDESAVRAMLGRAAAAFEWLRAAGWACHDPQAEADAMPADGLGVMLATYTRANAALRASKSRWKFW